jgi:hyaluronan synthase
MNIELQEPPSQTASASVVHERFPVSVVSDKGLFGARSVDGWAEYYDQESLCVKTDAPLPHGKKVSVRFKAPSALCPSSSGMECDLPGEVGSAQFSRSDSRYELILKMEHPLPVLIERSKSARLWKMGILLFGSLAWMVALRVTTLSFFWYDPLFYFYTISVGIFYLTRFYLSGIHRPPPPALREPTLSIVISARNEEEAISKTVESCFAALYPAEKKEVIVVDDGSTDGTAKVLTGLQRRFPSLKVFNIPPSGKRHGMAKGMREASGELLVFVDSDTIVDRLAFKQIIRGFDDPSVGASSGYCGVENSDKNLLTRMQDVRYVLSFDLMKAPEGVFGCVTCCPGVLSAYRREYIMKILDSWLNQTFLGAPATFGDDRSLTSYILRDYKVLYNPLAICVTLVPETWKQYLTQQCRWKKSWLRETLIAGQFIYKKHPIAALSFYISALCSVMSPFMVTRALWLGITDPNMALSGYLTGLVLLGLSMGLFILWRRPHRHWYLVWILIAAQVLVMGFQTYYAMLTMRKNHWGTR